MPGRIPTRQAERLVEVGCLIGYGDFGPVRVEHSPLLGCLGDAAMQLGTGRIGNLHALTGRPCHIPAVQHLINAISSNGCAARLLPLIAPCQTSGWDHEADMAFRFVASCSDQ